VVRLSASRTGSLYPQEMFLVLIFTRVWVDPRAMLRSEGICHWNSSDNTGNRSPDRSALTTSPPQAPALQCTVCKYPRFMVRNLKKILHAGTLCAVWALFDTLNIHKHSETTPIKTGHSALLDVVYSLLCWHQVTYNCMSTKNEMFWWNSSIMKHDINLQHLWDRMHRKAHVRL